jgi:hypothetical protein
VLHKFLMQGLECLRGNIERKAFVLKESRILSLVVLGASTLVRGGGGRQPGIVVAGGVPEIPTAAIG